MKRSARKLTLLRETLLRLGVVQGGDRPTINGSNCAACISQTIVASGVGCATNDCPTGAGPSTCDTVTC
jgi:hypothetical protein